MKWVTSRRTFSNWICDVIVEKTISYNHLCRKTRSQFHQQFMSCFIIRKCLLQLFCAYNYSLYIIFGKQLLVQVQGVNIISNLSTTSFCSFCQKLQIRTVRTEKAEQNTYVWKNLLMKFTPISFCQKITSKKLLIKCWWNWQKEEKF